ncbi:MAG TPA: TonB-dependent receptor [Gemmatimonadales bacterium]|nr:TonB-dependent receptor [Gemmatimonadales bacterium]
MALPLAYPTTAAAQGTAQTGSIAGRVVDEQGAPIANAQVYIVSPAVSAQTRTDGGYVLPRVPVGTHTLRARLLGFRPESASVSVQADARTTLDFTLGRDPLQLQTMVVTGTQTPRMNLAASVAITALTPEEIEAAQPRSTTEMLRYVPGFTRVESSGGEVNENITMRGILGVEYVMFMEDGLPVFPTMHTFFMNADNLFRMDENIERMEVVRGGSSSLFGSNTPGAIINFINKTGGDEFAGSMRVTGGTKGLARYDFNTNGPIGPDWRFNVGGFYRYDHGVRDPGYPGIRGGQLKGNITRLLSNGYLRFSAKIIDDRNQFILPLPFANPDNPEYVSGFSNYGSMNTQEGIDLRVRTPTGDLTLPLDNGLRTSGQWYTVDASFDLSKRWHLQNAAQIMRNSQEWNALLPNDLKSTSDFVTLPVDKGGLGFAPGSTFQYFYTNHFDAAGNKLPYDNPNDLVAPGGEWHVSKPLTAIQNQLQLRGTFGPHTLSAGVYVANYTQDNHWYFTDVLMDVRDNPRFLDLVVTPAGGGAPVNVTSNGFRNYLSNYVNGTGQTSVVSGVLGGEIQLTEKLRADLGTRVEYNKFVQSSENTSKVDLDGNPATTFDNETFGNGTFRQFNRGMTDWAASLGLNYALSSNVSLYGSAARAYKMPALDEFLNASAQQQVDLFGSREVQSAEGGVKYASRRFGATLNGFYTKLKNIVSQGAVVDKNTGATTWVIQTSPENRAYGAEVEIVTRPVEGLQLFGNGTFLRAELGAGAGADIGSLINGVPKVITNLAAVYTVPRARGAQLRGDWHLVGSRYADRAVGTTLPSYNYFNFGAGVPLGTSAALNVNLLNAFQSKGLEEGNPRLLSNGGAPIFLARPILPRRLTVSIDYRFGSSRNNAE